MSENPTIHWRTEWMNGTPTHVVSSSDASESQRREIEQAAEREGFQIEGDHWHLPEPGTQVAAFFAVARAKGYLLEFEREDDDAPVNLQRLKLDPDTRHKLETMPNFTLGELAGYVPVQGQGELDGLYWYFRALGSEWRIEERFRTEDRGRFEKGHPDYERTMLDGWSYRAISLERATKRLGISGQEAIERAKAHRIEIPWTANQEVAALGNPKPIVRGVDRKTGKLVQIIDEEDEH